MRRVAIVQARMNSSRLPGKVLKDVAGQPMLARQLRRLGRCTTLDDIVVATTTEPVDDAVVAVAGRAGVRVFRGSEADVLGRYAAAARDARADVVVRVTSDCPLIDAGVTDRVVTELTDHADACDYASNILLRTYPRGLDVEAFFADTLARMERLATSPIAREHVTVFIRSERPELFLLRSVTDAEDNSDLRWTVDTDDDLRLVRMICEGVDERAAYREVLEYVRARPVLCHLNDGVETWTPGR